MTNNAKPFVKWAGGKSQLLDDINKYYPPQLNGHIEYYYEPFIGGGAVFFDVIQRFNIKKAYIYDINKDLISAYKIIRSNLAELITQLNKIQEHYLPLSLEDRNKYYYEVRNEYNNNKTLSVKRSAQMIFLNKTCFNGLYRVNKKGLFNVPAGNYKNPKILDERNLLATSKLLQSTIIKAGDFENLRDDIKPNSFVYYDPPYRPLSPSANFTAYSKTDFTKHDQERLAKLFKELNRPSVFQLLSNSDPKNINPLDNYFEELYNGFSIYRVDAKRMINSDASKRGNIKELIITNY